MPQWHGVRVSNCCSPLAGAVTSTRWWLRLRRFSASASCFLYYGPSADLQPHLLGSTNPSSARGNADSYAASCWLRGSSSARVPHLREYYRTCNDAPPLWSRSFFHFFPVLVFSNVKDDVRTSLVRFPTHAAQCGFVGRMCTCCIRGHRNYGWRQRMVCTRVRATGL